MPRVEQAGLRQGENLLADAAPHTVSVAGLEVGTAGTAYQQAVAGKRHILVSGHVRQAAVRVAGSRAYADGLVAEGKHVAVVHRNVQVSDSRTA